MDDRKKFFGEGKDTAETLARMENALGKVIQESYAESNCSMTDTYKLAEEKLQWDRRFDNMDRSRLIQKAKEIGQSGGKLDMTDPFLWGGNKRPLSR